MLPLYALACIVVCLVAMLLWQQTKITLRSFLTWEDLLSAHKTVAMSEIAHLALEYSNPSLFLLRTEVDQRWDMIGGFRGLRIMRYNAELFISLAACAERWTPISDATAVKRMRSNGQALRTVTTKLFFLRMFRWLLPRNKSGVERAAALYFQQVETLSGLFSHGPRGSQQVLEVVLWHHT